MLLLLPLPYRSFIRASCSTLIVNIVLQHNVIPFYASDLIFLDTKCFVSSIALLMLQTIFFFSLRPLLLLFDFIHDFINSIALLMPNHFRFQQFFIFNSIDLAIFRVSCAQIKFMLWIVKTEKLVKNHPCLSFIMTTAFRFIFFLGAWCKQTANTAAIQIRCTNSFWFGAHLIFV